MSRIRRGIGIIALGASTGGPPALQEVITNLPKNLPVGMIVAQHMPPRFTQSLAERLNSLSEVTVSEAKNGDEIEPGHVYIAPGGKHMIILRNTSQPILNITKEPSESLYKPSVDIMMGSVLKRYGKRAMGVILTGMGNDGQLALKEIHEQGGVVIAQDEKTSVIYGMPKVVVDD